MGLDNGIEIRNIHRNMIPADKFDEFFWYPKKDNPEVGDYEICYWRKCWNIRNQIFDILEVQEDYYYDISRSNIIDIINLLGSFNKDNWHDGGGCIWTFEEMKPRLEGEIEVLKWLYDFYGKHPEIKVVFYDSY